MNIKRFRLIAGIFLILSAAAELFSLQTQYKTKGHKSTMTIMASGMIVLGILLIRKGTQKDNTNKPV